MSLIEDVDALIAPGRYPPRWGWHDDHRRCDGTPGYLPALQQVRGEFAGLLGVLARHQLPNGAGSLLDGRCLQLGVGESAASHEVWQWLFGAAVTIDWNGLYSEMSVKRPGADTHSEVSRAFAERNGPYDFLFIDAGHSYDDVKTDYLDYSPMVRKGGVIAFHDSLPRKGYDEVKVWQYLEVFGDKLNQIGSEVGIAWMAKE